jgi:RecB family exonuclease
MSVSFSYSAISAFNQCPYKYQRLYIKHEGWEESEYLEFGKFIHKMLQLYQKRLISVQKKKDTKWLADNYEEIYKNYMEKYDTKYNQKGKEILNFAMGIDFDYTKAVSIEHKFSARLDKETFINGVFDRAERLTPKTFLITDWKTGEAKPQDKMEEDLQYIIYSYAAQKLYPLYTEIKFRWVYLESGQCYELESYDVKKAEEILTESIAKMKSETEYKCIPQKLCLWCSFYKNSTCPDYEKIKEKFGK